MRKGKRIRIGILAGLLFWMAGAVTCSAGTIYESSHVTVTGDGKAWTTDAGVADCARYEEDTVVSTGIASSLRGLRTGEHYYTYSRTGSIPIGYFKVVMKDGRCVHNSYPPESMPYHNIPFGRHKCGKPYFSGWNAYCADCGGRVLGMLYMSREAASTISCLDAGTGMDYYYLCPHCSNLEQGIPVEAHLCREISNNQYRVHYDANAERYSGWMSDSVHMYNNATLYDGKPVRPMVCLSRNGFSRTGYRFTGWNTKADGTGVSFADGAEIWNLTSADCNQTPGAGIVTLYAQWGPVKSTLRIDPGEGRYQGKPGYTDVEGAYLSRYRVDSNAVEAPDGFTVRFDVMGGEPVDSVTGLQSFAGWQIQLGYQGDWREPEYCFTGESGNLDVLTAIYVRKSIVLPAAHREGYSFGGWYEDSGCERPAGVPGEAYLPGSDTVLYAKWVDLLLVAEDNHTANGGKGAVNLSWSQKDGIDKVYLIYQSRDGAEWTGINSVSDIGTPRQISLTYPYSGAEQTYTVPYSGFYNLTVYGAQGGGYGSYPGGKGGSASANLWLNQGEKLTLNVGGTNGYNGGGTGNPYAGGGGCSTVSIPLHKNFLVAGGGGGATEAGSGNAGGAGGSLLPTGLAGGSGGAGGGGGYRGGAAGERIVHHHIASCYNTVNTDYTLVKNGDSLYMNDWMKQYCNTYAQGTTGARNGLDGWHLIHYDSGSYGVVEKLFSIEGHSKNSDGVLEYRFGQICRNPAQGDYTFTNPSALGSGYIPVLDNTNLYLDIMMEYNAQAGYSADRTGSYVEVYNQNGSRIFRKTTAELPVIGEDRVAVKYASGSAISISSTPEGFYARFRENISIPQGTTSVYIVLRFGVKIDVWYSMEIMEVSFSGGSRTDIVCEYEEGQVLSYKPAYGGSNYVLTELVNSSEVRSGVQSGNGRIVLTSRKIGFMEDQALTGIPAPDLAAPNRVSPKKEVTEKNEIRIFWDRPEDNGTAYTYKVESYERNSESRLCESNITGTLSKTGVRGYYYRIDDDPTAGTMPGDSLYTEGLELIVQPGESVYYLHIAAVDRAGNLSEVSHVRIDSIYDSEEGMLWRIHTTGLEILESESVFAADEVNTYYVKSDGKEPFALRTEAVLDGPARAEYQPETVSFAIERENGRRGAYRLTGAYQDPADCGVLAPEQISAGTTGQTMLGSYPYTCMERRNRCGTLSVTQMFVLDEDCDGERIFLYPKASASWNGEVVSSGEAQDREGGIWLIGDNTPPTITGAEALENLPLIDRNDGAFVLTVKAQDSLSGLKEFYAEVTNLDNHTTERIEADGDTLFLDLTQDNVIFNGDFEVKICAADQVGNVRELSGGTTEFSLDVTVERILEPHTPVFQCGESGILTIAVTGYAERVEVEFAPGLARLDPELNQIYDYEGMETYLQEERQQFMIPLYAPQNESFAITVRAYKGNRCLEEHPVLRTIAVETSVLTEFRTRLR